MRQGFTTILATFLIAAVSAVQAQPVQMALVPVGDAGNVADPLTGYGAVSYSYSIGEYDVTMGQYTAFLNAVATTSDPYGLWTPSMSSATPTYGITRTSTSGVYSYAAKGNSANVPVTYTSWFDAVRFCNWLQNGEPVGPEGPGTTETGSYNVEASTVTRGPNATWILPNLNEWYKAAYYSGGGTNSSYWDYPTQNDSAPSNVLSASGTNNANYEAVLGDPPLATRSDPTNWLTPVGSYSDSPGAFGTFDMGGDVYQWNETTDGTSRGLRGGGFAESAASFVPGAYADTDPTVENEEVGFRVAYVPEPATSTTVLFAAAVAAFAFMYLNRSGYKITE